MARPSRRTRGLMAAEFISTVSFPFTIRARDAHSRTGSSSHLAARLPARLNHTPPSDSHERQTASLFVDPGRCCGQGGPRRHAPGFHDRIDTGGDPATIYAGSEVGLFVSHDRGATWALPQQGPANVSVDELFVMGSTLVAATHGRGLFAQDLNPQGTPTLSIAPITSTSARSRPTIRPGLSTSR
jgi:hypothetical protein